MSRCPCGSGAAYEACCGRFHAGPLHWMAPTPEALMRSRYSAYALGLRDYVLYTWHASTRPEKMERFDSGVKWLGLTVKRAWTASADEGFVEFVARSKPPGGGPAERLHELSRFVRSDGLWQYIDAVENQSI
ncbi:MAG: YchJ family metal-binding protein [Casimicrobium sp.]